MLWYQATSRREIVHGMMSTNSQSYWKLHWRLRIRHKQTGTLANTRYCWGLNILLHNRMDSRITWRGGSNLRGGGGLSSPFQTVPRSPNCILYNGYGTSFLRMKRTGPVVDHPSSCSYNSTSDLRLHGTFKVNFLLQKDKIFATSCWPLSCLRTSFLVVLFVSIFASSCKYLEHNNPIK
jgi:hypothetical protein